MTRKLELVLSPAGVGCSVLLDGEPVKNCRAITVRAEVGKASTVTLEIVNVEVSVRGEAETHAIEWKDVTGLTDTSRRFGSTDGREVTAEEIVAASKQKQGAH